MPSIYTAIEIDAPRSHIWKILIQKERWKYWNTFLYDCDPSRPFEVGRDVALSVLRTPGDEEIQFRPIVLVVQPTFCLRLLSTIPGMKNEHVFELQDIERDRTQFLYQQTYSGTLTKILLPFIRHDERKGIQRMAWELKHYAEQRSR